MSIEKEKQNTNDKNASYTSDKNASSTGSARSERIVKLHGMECKVRSVTQNAGLIPTIAVVFWLGWMSILIYSSLYFFFFSSRSGAQAFLLVCMTSVLLPRKFPGVMGVKIGNWLMAQAERYFGLTTTIEDYEALEEYSSRGKAVIFAVEPHDVLPYGVFAFNPSLKIFPGKVGNTSSVLMTSAVFNIPFIKHVYSWVGGEPVDAKTFRSKLERSESLGFIPGGVQEILMMDPMQPNDILMYLKNRKGFIKIALQYGSPVVPVFIFNLDGSYNWWFPRGNKFIAKISRIVGFVPLLFTGRFGIPFFIPKPRKLHLVCGRPIDIPLMSSVSANEEDIQLCIDKYHAIFCTEMIALYDRHKVAAGYEFRKLVLV